MRVKTTIVISLLCCLVLLCSCDYFGFDPVDSLIRAPKLSGDNGELQKVFEASVGDKVVLKCPMSGKHRSAFTVMDIDADGIDEAIVFYAYTKDDTSARINILDKDSSGAWHSVADTYGPGSDVNSLSLIDINGDGVSEILVTWNVLDSKNKYVTIYGGYNCSTLSTGSIKNYITEMFTAMYPVDVDCDGQDEIFITVQDAVLGEYIAYGRLLGYDSTLDKIYLKSEIKLDGAVVSYLSITSDYMNNAARIYIDGVINADYIQTELVVWEPETRRLVVPVDSDGKTWSAKTLRAQSMLSEDKDGDGRIEVPSLLHLPGAVRFDSEQNITEKLFLNVRSALVDDSLKDVEIFIDNPNARYFFNIPSEWIGVVTAKFNVKENILQFYSYDVSNDSPETHLFSLFTIDSNNKELLNSVDKFIIFEGKSLISYAEISPSGIQFGISQELIREYFIAY